MIRFLLISAVDHQRYIEVHHPSLGLGYIASSLRQRFGNLIKFKVVNGCVEDNIKTFQPDIVGITSTSRDYNIAKEYAAIIGQAKLPVIIGGAHITFMPTTITEDMIVGIDGEGEKTILDLMCCFLVKGKFDKSELYDIDGVFFKDNGGLVKTKQRKLIRTLDDVPLPARDLLDISKSAHMLTSRGCPYHCVFCSTARLTRNQSRYTSPAYAVNEMEVLYKDYGVEYITTYDDLFAVDSKRLIEMQELLVKRNLIGKFRMAVNIRADFITDEMAEVLSQMNVDVVALGTESGCQRTLDYLKSGTLNVEDNAKAIDILKRHRLIPYCSFIFGSPNEDYEDIMETVAFIKNNNVNYFDLCILTPYPGTPIWDYALSRGIVSDDMDWSRLDFYYTANPVFLSEKLALTDIIKVCDKLYHRKARHKLRVNLLLGLKHPRLFIRLIFGKVKGALNI